MEIVSELTNTQKMLLRLCKQKPDHKFTGLSSREMSIMGSYNLVDYAGGLRWTLKPEGEEAYKVIISNFKN